MMKFNAVYQTYWDSKADKYFEQIVPLIEKYFEGKHYSSEVKSFLVGLYCTPSRDVKDNSKYIKKEKEIILSIIIDYASYILLDEEKRKSYIASSFIKSMYSISKFKIQEFNLKKMIGDFTIFFENIGWLKDLPNSNTIPII